MPSCHTPKQAGAAGAGGVSAGQRGERGAKRLRDGGARKQRLGPAKAGPPRPPKASHPASGRHLQQAALGVGGARLPLHHGALHPHARRGRRGVLPCLGQNEAASRRDGGGGQWNDEADGSCKRQAGVSPPPHTPARACLLLPLTSRSPRAVQLAALELDLEGCQPDLLAVRVSDERLLQRAARPRHVACSNGRGGWLS